MSIHYRRSGGAIIIFGNTYPVRERIKAIGARYEGLGRTWRVPFSEDRLAVVHALCSEHGGGPLGGMDQGALDDSRESKEAFPLAPVASPASYRQAAATSGDIELPGLPHPSSSAVRASSAFFADETRNKPATAGLSIRELMDRASMAIAGVFPSTVWVLGEVQNLSKRPSGIYFDLAEAREGAHQSATVTVRSVVWSQALSFMEQRHGRERLAEVLQDGMKLRCLCQVQLYRDRGQLSLVVEDIDPAYTKGALALAREKLLKELRVKGLDQANKKHVLTPFPLRIGLISADESRAQSDFLHQLWTHGFPGKVLFQPTPMQGDSVPRRVVGAIKQLTAAGCDLIVITRGGGSAADLRWFDAAEIAYAIAACPLPIVAAIGHHDDVAVAEEICFMRQKTPTAAADFIINWFGRTGERIDQLAGGLAQLLSRRVDEFSLIQAALSERMNAAAERALATRSERLLGLRHGLERLGLERIGGGLMKLTQAASSMQRAAEQALSHRDLSLRELETALTRRDPSPWLATGWTQLSGPNGLVKTLADVELGDAIHARLRDGKLGLIVKTKRSGADQTKET